MKTNQDFELIVNSDPTLKQFLRSNFSYSNLNHQIDLRIFAFKKALQLYLDEKYS